MKARMRDNLVELYESLSPSIVDMPDEQTKDFLRSIQGKEIELVFTCGDAFEKKDNRFWLPNQLWYAEQG